MVAGLFYPPGVGCHAGKIQRRLRLREPGVQLAQRQQGFCFHRPWPVAFTLRDSGVQLAARGLDGADVLIQLPQHVVQR